VRSTVAIAHAAIGRIGRPAFPAPSFPEGRGSCITRAFSRREKADVCSRSGPLLARECSRNERAAVLN